MNLAFVYDVLLDKGAEKRIYKIAKRLAANQSSAVLSPDWEMFKLT